MTDPKNSGFWSQHKEGFVAETVAVLMCLAITSVFLFDLQDPGVRQAIGVVFLLAGVVALLRLPQVASPRH